MNGGSVPGGRGAAAVVAICWRRSMAWVGGGEVRSCLAVGGNLVVRRGGGVAILVAGGGGGPTATYAAARGRSVQITGLDLAPEGASNLAVATISAA